MSCEKLTALSEMSNRYGADADFVLAGGGNTSYKTADTLFVKGSGTSLATIKPDDFLRIDRTRLGAMWTKQYPADSAAREAEVLTDLMNSRCVGENRRPSVETMLHDMFPYAYVLHVHPAAVNALTCAVGGKAAAARLFPDAVWVAPTKPGYTLSIASRDASLEKQKTDGAFPKIVFLENHGVFFAADTTDEIDGLVNRVMTAVRAEIKTVADLSPVAFDADRAAALAPVLRMKYGKGYSGAVVRFSAEHDVLDYADTTKCLTPDHIVYIKAKQLVLPADTTEEQLAAAFDVFTAENGYMPRIVIVKELGCFACGGNMKEMLAADAIIRDATSIIVGAQSFGGLSAMPDDLTDFIVNWEVESYRSKVSLSAGSAKRLAGKITVITGGAQGFGKGIADAMAAEGALIVVADMNEAGAKAAAECYGSAGYAVAANVTDEDSVKNMMNAAVLAFGGIDIFVNNAGVVKAGSLDEMTKAGLEFVASVNYTGYFLCTKYSSKVMKIQHRYAASDCLFDIIEINSKSGLSGSNKNFAYAGSKFGGIGLTQSFAMELVEYGIKVNAVCPGNFLNGPLWSDPERGLFVQYLKAGKVPGAKTVDDVRRAYEAKVPLGRGCETLDVARAIFYIVEQDYETGQAVPVTGGQEMLK